MIAIDNTLLKDVIKIFIKKEPVSYTQELLNLIKYIQAPIIIGKFQIQDIRLLSQSGGIIKSIDAIDDNDLATKTKLKLILTKKPQKSKDDEDNFPYIDINADEFESNFTATYTSGTGNKQKVLKHIKSLMQEGNKIEIYDKYLLFDNGDNSNKNNNHNSVKIINNIISSLTSQELKIYCKFDLGNNGIRSRKNNITYTNLSFIHNNLNFHDRYIKILNNSQLKYEIILSSGLYNILGNSDFTYVVRVF